MYFLRHFFSVLFILGVFQIQAQISSSKHNLQSLNGNYFNNETDAKFALAYQSDQTYEVNIFSEKKNDDMTAKDQLRIGGIKIHIQQNDFVTSLATADGGKITVSTIGGTHRKTKQNILLTKNNAAGNEEWYKIYGGSSYDRASSLTATKDGGYLIVGSTSSFGAGNYDVYIIKVNAKGKEEWSSTYGDKLNEYGLTAEEQASGYLIKGTKQICGDTIDFTDCKEEMWIIEISESGKRKFKQ